MTNDMSDWKVIIIHLTVGLIKKIYKMSQYSSKPYECSIGNVSNLSAKSDVASSKVEVNRIDWFSNWLL